jgi:hypothetical protein
MTTLHRRRFLSGAVAAAGSLSLPACSTLPRPAYTAAEAATAEIPGIPGARYFEDSPPEVWARAAAISSGQERAAARRGGVRPRSDLLALSGGGDDGAYGAGLLCGWSERGDRPVFRAVTGVSTGALIAPLAFLGSGYDPALKAAYTTLDTPDLIEVTGLSGVLFGEALLAGAPLRDLVARYADDALIEAVAREHATGRRLFAGTTDLDSQRTAIWDLGAIAASGHPGRAALFRDVLVASASIPIAYPPVLIEVEGEGRRFSEMHVDGGVTAQVLTLTAPLRAIDRTGVDGGRRPAIYILMNQRIGPEFTLVKRSVATIGSRSIATLTKTHGRSAIREARDAALRRGWTFRLTSIGDDFTVPEPAPFDRAYMNALFDYGLRRGRDGKAWSNGDGAILA